MMQVHALYDLLTKYEPDDQVKIVVDDDVAIAFTIEHDGLDSVMLTVTEWEL